MEVATVPQTEKRLYRNNTAGWLGVVQLNVRGEEEGVNVEPYGTIWLSDAEAILTARAPRRAEDNPFEEQVFIRQNPDTGAREEYKMRPLTLEPTDSRYVPSNDRYVPTQVQPQAPDEAAPPVAQTAATPPEPVDAPPSSGSGATQPPAPAPAVAAATAPAPRPRTAPVGGPPSAPVTSASGQRVEGEHASPDGDERESWIVDPEAPGQVLAGQLGGDDSGADAESAPDPTHAPTQAERYVPPVTQGAAVQQPGAEEHAQAVDPRVGEETGAARPPAAPAPQGEYASREEVGSPNAPAVDEEPVEGLIGA